MSWKDNKLVFQRIQLFTNRAENLIIVSPLEVRPAYAAIKERISTKHTIGTTNQAYTPRSMAGRMEDLKRECTESKAIPFLQQHIWLPCYKWRGPTIQLRDTFIRIHTNIIWMDRQRHGINGAHCVNRTHVVDMAVRVNNIPGDKLKFLNSVQNTFSLITGVNNNRLARLRTGIEVTVLLESANRHTGNDWHRVSRLLFNNIRHTVFSFPLQATTHRTSRGMRTGPLQTHFVHYSIGKNVGTLCVMVYRTMLWYNLGQMF